MSPIRTRSPPMAEARASLSSSTDAAGAIVQRAFVKHADRRVAFMRKNR